jgi:HEAT repeat protein
LVALFDVATETQLRLTVIAALAQEGSKPARDKLIAIASSTEVGSVRRRAVSALNRFDGEEVREALSALAVP